MLEVVSIMVDIFNYLHTFTDILIGNGLNGFVNHSLIDQPKNLTNIFILDLFPSIRNYLVKKALSISQASFRGLGNEEQPPLADFDSFFLNDSF